MKDKKKQEEIKDENIHQCDCEKDCKCEETCDCQKDDCGCGHESCHCGEDCHCHEGEKCSDDCDCQKGDTCTCEHPHKHHHSAKEAEYLEMAQRLQADFENYRRHVAEQLNRERQMGAVGVIEAFLPCLDTFKDAKKNIADESVLAGINMIENKILEALKSQGVEKTPSIGEKFNPHLHEVITCMSDAEKEDDIILEEYQSGWTMNGKVIRYAKVIVNKK